MCTHDKNHAFAKAKKEQQRDLQQVLKTHITMMSIALGIEEVLCRLWV
uniref:Uncharacterized protein n=1 Tax=uncultured Dokdonia sp. TaxID=575653 RepID=H6RGR6_9FLAO|nr:hypothetical protein VIS_S18CPB10015 [uncultured Dokdonia sp.]